MLYRALERGRTDFASVRLIQRELQELGYPIGAVDGIFGDQTRIAIAQWQRDTGQRVKGLGLGEGEIIMRCGAIPRMIRGRRIMGGLACY